MEPIHRLFFVQPCPLNKLGRISKHRELAERLKYQIRETRGKVMIRIVIAIIALFILGACGINAENNPSNEPQHGFIGNVVQRDGDRILVVDPVSKDFSSSGGMENVYSAVWFSNSPSDVEVGQKVEVWSGEILTSYPGQGKAERVSIIPAKPPEGAALSEKEVIQKTLSSKVLADLAVPAVKEVIFDRSLSFWTVTIGKNGDENVLYIKIEDKMLN